MTTAPTWEFVALILGLAVLIIGAIVQMIKSFKPTKQRAECTDEFMDIKNMIEKNEEQNKIFIAESQQHRSGLERRIAVLETRLDTHHKEIMQVMADLRTDVRALQLALLSFSVKEDLKR